MAEEMAGSILLRAIVGHGRGDAGGNFPAHFLTAVRTAGEFRDTLPAPVREGCEAVPMVTDLDEGALRHFRAITAVIDRCAGARRGR